MASRYLGVILIIIGIWFILDRQRIAHRVRQSALKIFSDVPSEITSKVVVIITGVFLIIAGFLSIYNP